MEAGNLSFFLKKKTNVLHFKALASILKCPFTIGYSVGWLVSLLSPLHTAILYNCNKEFIQVAHENQSL